jgi:hypothetical protein
VDSSPSFGWRLGISRHFARPTRWIDLGARRFGDKAPERGAAQTVSGRGNQIEPIERDLATARRADAVGVGGESRQPSVDLLERLASATVGRRRP